MIDHYDIKEVEKFTRLSGQWWNEAGELKTLHHLNPVRLDYIRSKITLLNKQILDIGCGGGILTESLAKLGAQVTGIDASAELIEIAQHHQRQNNLSIDYQHTTAEAFAKQHAHAFEVITCLELLEHVPDPASLIQAVAELAQPKAHLFFSTINRHPKAYLYAILGAEYVLKLLPKQTHDYAKFIRPSELVNWLSAAGLETKEITGLKYHPFSEKASLCDDLSVNYLLYAVKP
jgi:2-polyprenyl-6-hydroxyphenyl methylase/3-demethylubiquinone-9 3-methyltransferase